MEQKCKCGNTTCWEHKGRNGEILVCGWCGKYMKPKLAEKPKGKFIDIEKFVRGLVK